MRIALLIGAVVALSAQLDPLVAAEPARFTVATYNINWGNVDLRQTTALIRKAGADLVLLQETNARSEAWLRQTLRDRYPHMVFRGDREKYPAERFGVLSKAPINGMKFLPARHGLFGTWLFRVRLAGGDVQVANVHLQPAYFEEGETARDAFRVLQRVEETHRKEIAAILDALEKDVPTIVAGDFNSLSLFVAPSQLKARGMIDSFATVEKDPDNQPSWHWPVGRGEIALRIDYIFHSPHFKTVESQILPSTASDHNPVISRLEWVGPQ